MHRHTFNDRLEQFFRAHPGQWVSSVQLEFVAGRMAWRTRVSDVRRQRGLDIQNRTRKVRRDDGTAYTISEYRFVPADLFDAIPSEAR